MFKTQQQFCGFLPLTLYLNIIYYSEFKTDLFPIMANNRRKNEGTSKNENCGWIAAADGSTDDQVERLGRKRERSGMWGAEKCFGSMPSGGNFEIAKIDESFLTCSLKRLITSSIEQLEILRQM